MKKSEILAATNWRRAIKKYDPAHKISDEDWSFLLDVARLAPSSYGFEPWNIIDVNSPELRTKIKPALLFNSAKLDAAHFVIFTVKKDLGANSKYFREILKQNGVDLVGRTALLTAFKAFLKPDEYDLSDERKLHDWAAKQAYIAFAQMIFAAAEIGVDSTPIEGFKKNELEKILAENGALDPETDSVAICAAFGYRAEDPRTPKSRRPIDQVVKTI